MDLDPFQHFLDQQNPAFPKEEFQFPANPIAAGMDQFDLPTSSSMLQDPMNLADYEMGFSFQDDDSDLSFLDPSSFLLNEPPLTLDNTPFPTFPPQPSANSSELLTSLYDSEGEINIDTSSYITPDEIDKFEKSFPVPGIKSKLQELLRKDNKDNETLFKASDSENSDVEEGELVDHDNPSPHLTKQFVAKCTEGTKEPAPLPQGWVQVWHKCGMPLYFNSETRVVTWSRPYLLPKSRNVRTHFTPVDSIPCMKEWVFGKKDGARVLEETCGIKNVKEHQDLSGDKVRVYLRNLWEFEENTVENYKKDNIVGKRTYKNDPNVVELELPKGTGEVSKFPKVWKVNLLNKTPVVLMEEYSWVQFKTRPEYTYREVTDIKNPFICTLKLRGNQYASEGGSSKKLAKYRASEVSLKLVCPKLYQKFREFQNKKYCNFNGQLKELYEMKIDDASAMTKLMQAGLPRPFQILKQCLQNNNFFDKKPEFEEQQKEDNTYFLRLVVGKFEASVNCTNKRDGKNIISQKILSQMYPGMSLGALVDLHSNIEHLKGKKDMPTPAECKEMAMGLHDKPKTKILEILRSEMMKVSERLKEGKPISEKFAKLEAQVYKQQ